MSWTRIREFAMAIVLLSLLMGTAYAYTGTWPPAVIVESSSMMHARSDVPYGRFGTLDVGDLVLVKDVEDASDVRTLLEGGRDRYAAAGDVIVFHPGGATDRTPIIHRAIAYVAVDETPDGTTYRVRWAPDAPCAEGSTRDGSWCVFSAEGIRLPDLGIVHPDGRAYKPNGSGFITKGDNPDTNRYADPIARISHDADGAPSVVDPTWITGVSRGELPWLGLMKLAIAPTPNERTPPPSYVQIGQAYAPPDLWVMLGTTLIVLVVGPLLVDVARRRD